MKRILAQIIPFIYLGIILVIFVVGFIFISYVLIIGAIAGLILFAIAWIRNKFHSQKNLVKHERTGRTIDHH